ncbi:CCA tRNA nucleotidyltransferase [Qipengyuania spongiae]|uniref:CCA tRNA nucleotidyltransferase n=1 Tax=Qipengyuania spongiae TaxID=2909673 RepID=A0ABY5T770_9SPHN|nr:CCA tRNA nucleotidyltransferase [Qipengyuania spongiae]UVI40789.1 CCA tRNA nucleotidyltransferase [Qipengyuania spongiae]
MPATEWTGREDLAALVDALGAEDVRWVGGCVRDALIGCVSNDIDAATRHRPERVIDLCREAGIRTVPTGFDHGTVTAILPHGNVEVTTLRCDVATDGRHAEIAFADDWRDDAARRDFTINALYAHPRTLEISDYFGGLEDLDTRHVRFIGDARTRIREDHLRILRYFRFSTRFAAEWDEEASEACRELAPSLKGLSRERVGWELLNLLGLPDPAPTVAKMRELGVLQQVLPECRQSEVAQLERLIAAEAAHCTAPEALRRLAAMLPAVPALAETIAARLRLSRSQRDRLACVAARRAEDAMDPRGLAYREGIACATDRLLLSGGNPASLKNWEVPSLPLKGGEIVRRGIGKGPEVARLLRAVEQRWIAEGFPDRRRVETLLDEALAAR